MQTTTALIIAVGIVAGATLIGILLKRRGTRVRSVESAARLNPQEFGGESFGAGGTVIQFSTVYCTRCPATKRLISETVAQRDGVAFIHVDVTNSPQLVSKYQLTQTPTVLLLDGAGAPRTRLSGVISRATLTTELDSTIGAHA